MVEKGFSHLYDQCSDDVKRAVGAAGAARLIVTGHSLGEALATLATADLVLAGTAASMYNFASPRTGDLDFAAQFDKNVNVRFRVVNTEDIVITVPLATLALENTKMNHLHALFAIATHFGDRLNFEHVGIPVNFTSHNGSVVGNHQMPTYAKAL
jgi:predicted lipase